MSQIIRISGTALPLVGNDIDTDRIIPARFLRCVTFDGLGEQAFADDRAQGEGNHPFDLPQYQLASILVVNGNFGCGSSREHAPQSLARWGIKGIIGESFAEIFFGNCLAIGVPCIILEPDSVQKIQAKITANPEILVTVDLEATQVICGEEVFTAKINEGVQGMFLKGTWDNCSQLTQNAALIRKTVTKLPYLNWNLA